jgi:hypothetical protein
LLPRCPCSTSWVGLLLAALRSMLVPHPGPQTCCGATVLRIPSLSPTTDRHEPARACARVLTACTGQPHASMHTAAQPHRGALQAVSHVPAGVSARGERQIPSEPAAVIALLLAALATVAEALQVPPLLSARDAIAASIELERERPSPGYPQHPSIADEAAGDVCAPEQGSTPTPSAAIGDAPDAVEVFVSVCVNSSGAAAAAITPSSAVSCPVG